MCPKCENRYAEVDKIRNTGSGFTRYFNIQNRKFTAVTCSKYGYTEFYRDGVADTGSNVPDFFNRLVTVFSRAPSFLSKKLLP